MHTVTLEFVNLDASMHNLTRPAMYGSYHHVTVLPGADAGSGSDAVSLTPGATHTYDVTGSLCEHNDQFAIDRERPQVYAGDVAVIHDAGAHGHSMGFNDNGTLRSTKYLLGKDGRARRIRRAETMDELVDGPVRMALWQRDRQGHPIVRGELIGHADAGSQYTSITFTDHLADEGILPAIGSVPDAYDNTLMESVIGPYKTECIRATVFHPGPYRTIAEVEYATAGWFDP